VSDTGAHVNLWFLNKDWQNNVFHWFVNPFSFKFHVFNSANPCLRTRGSHEPLYHSPGKEALLQHIQVMLLFFPGL
jgi:hypothetical protein